MIIKKITYDSKDVYQRLANKIATLEIQLANEQAAKKAIMKYAEELESKLNEKAAGKTDKNTEGEDGNEVRNQKH